MSLQTILLYPEGQRFMSRITPVLTNYPSEFCVVVFRATVVELKIVEHQDK